MIGSDVQRVVAEALTTFTLGGAPVPVYRTPYGTDGTPDTETLRINAPLGWVLIGPAHAATLQAVYGRWVINLDAGASTPEQAEQLARHLARHLHSTPRRPTAFSFQGDTSYASPVGIPKRVLTFLATVRHEE